MNKNIEKSLIKEGLKEDTLFECKGFRFWSDYHHQKRA
jgi:hypothetical protein